MFHTVHMFYNFIMFHTVHMFYNFNLGLFGIFLSYWVVFFKLEFYILWNFCSWVHSQKLNIFILVNEIDLFHLKPGKCLIYFIWKLWKYIIYFTWKPGKYSFFSCTHVLGGVVASKTPFQELEGRGFLNLSINILNKKF